MKQGKLRFQPFRGSGYEFGVHGLKLLLLGESHYGAGEPDPEETIREFREFAQESCEILRGRNFWAHVQRLGARCVNPTKAQSAAAWRRLAFSNFVQGYVSASTKRPSRSEWQSGNAAFSTLLDKLTPDVVLVLGRANWNNIDHGHRTGDAIGTFSPAREIWRFPHRTGTALSTWVYHPSARCRQFNLDESIRILDSLLTQARMRRDLAPSSHLPRR